MAEWRIQIFLVSDATAQELIAALLAGLDRLVVEPASSDFDHFIIVESADDTEAEGIQRLIRTIDPAVTLIHTSAAEPLEPTTA